ncbi:putative O-succinylbenzoate synthase [Prochlorococcus marinus str. MIT 9515]|uniref:Putative O-succinylbenzoate synthase n=1 Tax=Prochlorococcus marinus (strain MIT 9515) TaxID=167542 RepID=A2BUF2_PROM5|nr:o-succinylbenzoate synthase [Prochlorococcus marinus]ABM71413.1 putative O-succinylbenzoate synthase [Prochlorococcus marinus str. MIT 9515]
MNLTFKKKSFLFKLSSKVENSKTTFKNKSGWIIKLKNVEKGVGFGEVNPLSNKDLVKCQIELNKIPKYINSKNISELINTFHPCIQSAINSALAEIERKIIFKENYFFNAIDQTAILLNPNNALQELKKLKENKLLKGKLLTIKWKVAIYDNASEEKTLIQILNQLTSNIKLRIDANGSWERGIANRWVDILKDIKNIDWLEQPLSKDDIEGLREINKRMPIALDESLLKYPHLINEWDGWQIRRPSQEKNPMHLLEELKNKKGFRSLSTSFETGIGNRWLFHLSSLQLLGPTPKVPGLALKKNPNSFLFLNKAQKIWDQL